VQAFYDAEYLFTVNEDVFIPPPKVKSGVLRLRRKTNFTLPCSEKLLFTVVKTAFQQRRKTLRNSLKTLNLTDNLREDTIFDLRPEQLSVEQFIALTQKIEQNQQDIDKMTIISNKILSILVTLVVVAGIYLLAEPILGTYVHMLAAVALTVGIFFTIYY
jgi:hypothetical protein